MAMRGGLDLDGRIVIKVQLGNDVRKMLIHNDDVTYDELVLMMQRVFKGTIKQNDDITIKYKDEDGDLITIFDTSDVSFAIQTCNRQLKLVLFINGLERNFDDAEVETIRRGLQDLRDKAINLLDQIDAKTKHRSPSNRDEQTEVNVKDGRDETTPAVTSDKSAAAVTSSAPPVEYNKEFDPLDGSLSAEQTHSSQQVDNSDVSSQHGGGGGGSQYGGDYSHQQRISKSFDQMSDKHSINQSPTPSSLQQSFGSAFNQPVPQNLQQQQQQPNQMSNQMSQQSQASSVYNGGPAAAAPANSYYQQQSQYGAASGAQTNLTSAPGVMTSPAGGQQYQQQMSQPGQQGQQYNYPSSQQQKNQQQTWQQQQQQPNQGTPSHSPYPTQPSAPGQQQQLQQQQYGGGYSQPHAQTGQSQAPGMYGQTQPAPYEVGRSPTPNNPYSNKPGQLRGGYPRAMGNYPNIQQPGGVRPPTGPGYPPQ